MASWSNLVRDSERVSGRKRTWSDLVEGSGVDMEEKQEKQEERDNKKMYWLTSLRGIMLCLGMGWSQYKCVYTYLCDMYYLSLRCC